MVCNKGFLNKYSEVFESWARNALSDKKATHLLGGDLYQISQVIYEICIKSVD